MIQAVETALSIIQAQTKRIRRFLRHNRTRIVYRVEGDDGFCKNVYSLRKAINLVKSHPGGCMWRGKQKANWIKGGDFTGIKWNKKDFWTVRQKKDKDGSTLSTPVSETGQSLEGSDG